MVRLCSFTLENGSRCRCVANRGRDVCRHHTPEGLQGRQPREPIEAPEMSDSDRRRAWRGLRTSIRTAQDDLLDSYLETIMGAAAAGTMTHRTAGKLLVCIFHRREELYDQSLRDQLRPLQEAVDQYGLEYVKAALADAIRSDPKQVISFPTLDANWLLSPAASHTKSAT